MMNDRQKKGDIIVSDKAKNNMKENWVWKWLKWLFRVWWRHDGMCGLCRAVQELIYSDPPHKENNTENHMKFPKIAWKYGTPARSDHLVKG